MSGSRIIMGIDPGTNLLGFGVIRVEGRDVSFVDMGVGKGRPISKVERRLSADYKIRYMEWDAKQGSTQRPAISMEFRHQTRRMQRYWVNRFKFDAQCVLVFGIEGSLDGNEPDYTT